MAGRIPGGTIPKEKAMARLHPGMPPELASYGPVSGDPAVYHDPVLRMGVAWLDLDNEADAVAEAETSQPFGAGLNEIGMAALVDSVAGIVAIAASRARQGGDLLALREAVDRALGPMPFMGRGPNDPREALMAPPPAIHDADHRAEVDRLRALMRRQAAI